MPFYWYKRGGWEIAVDAVSRQDANHHIHRWAYGAVFQGEWKPPTMLHPSTATGMITSRRQEQIHDALVRENEAWEAAGRPGAWWEKPTEEPQS
jgi:hypothetical protein